MFFIVNSPLCVTFAAHAAAGQLLLHSTKVTKMPICGGLRYRKAWQNAAPHSPRAYGSVAVIAL